MRLCSFGRVREFLGRDGRGALTPLILVLFIGILLTTGIALDLARHESERADLQDALDRGVLAAASLTQTIEPETVINDYLATRSLSHSALTVSIDADAALSSRRIDAGARYTMNTIFLHMAGLPELDVPASSAAQQSGTDFEISLVLDISGSMAREDTSGSARKRLDVLRTSAANFVDSVLDPSVADATTVSLVPYSGQVNAGAMFNHFNTSRVHNHSSCIEFIAGDFETTALPGENSRAQVPHFQWFDYEGAAGHEAEWGWCPGDGQAIVPFSNDATALKAQIAGFVGHDGTGTPNGLKWGLGLLDPGTRPVTQALVNAGRVDPSFAERPSDFGETGVQKILVIMTDGNIRYQQRPKPEHYDEASERERLAEEILPPGWATLTNENEQEEDEAIQVSRFLNLCALAKDNGVLVYTIGFDISQDSDAFGEMQTCASTESHFYDVDGIDLDTAFQQIAASITQLKLVL